MVGVGGYLAGPVMLEAALVGIPTVLMEPNVRPGFTNRLLRPFVRVAALGFPETAQLYGKKARVTGLPVRRAFFDIPRYIELPADTSGAFPGGRLFTVLVVGGSQGARAINRVVAESFWQLALAPGRLRIIHQTGERDYNEVLNAYQRLGLAAEVHAFIDDMPGTLAQVDLVISRAGATAVTEFAAAGRAALLVPFPGAADQHQLDNARAMERVGAARVILQSELTPEQLARAIRELMSSPGQLEKMANSAGDLAKPDAASRIADLVEGLSRQ